MNMLVNNAKRRFANQEKVTSSIGRLERHLMFTLERMKKEGKLLP
jgi:hypothetical protein